jgi:hypothetical protein
MQARQGDLTECQSIQGLLMPWLDTLSVLNTVTFSWEEPSLGPALNPCYLEKRGAGIQKPVSCSPTPWWGKSLCSCVVEWVKDGKRPAECLRKYLCLLKWSEGGVFLLNSLDKFKSHSHQTKTCCHPHSLTSNGSQVFSILVPHMHHILFPNSFHICYVLCHKHLSVLILVHLSTQSAYSHHNLSSKPWKLRPC